MKIDGVQPTACNGCEKTPHAYEEHGRHFVECSRCGVVTPRHNTQAEAVQAWNKFQRHGVRVTA